MMWRFVLVSSFAFIALSTQMSCPNQEVLDVLMEHTEKSETTKFLTNKEFIDVARHEEFVTSMSCSMSKFIQTDKGDLRVLVHNIGKDGRIFRFRDKWDEVKGTGVFNIKGFSDNFGEYDEKLFILHADENVVAYYACNPETYNTEKFFRVALSLHKSKMNDPEAKKSIETALKKMKELESVIGSVIAMPTTGCPAQFPEVQPPTPTVLTKAAV